MAKFCPKCGFEKPESEYNWKIRDVKRAVHCRECSRKYIREHYKNNLKYYLDKASKRNNKLKNECRKYIGEYLSTHPCVDCGEKNILVLEFDHRNRLEKDFDVSRMSQYGYSVKQLAYEISKCDVRCANCHRRKTALETNSWKLKYAPIA